MAPSLVSLAASEDGRTLFALEPGGLLHRMRSDPGGETLTAVDRLELRIGSDQEAVEVALNEDTGELLVVTRSRRIGGAGSLRRYSIDGGRLLARLDTGRSTGIDMHDSRCVVTSSAGLPIFDATERTFERDPGDLTIVDLDDPMLLQSFSVPVRLEGIPGLTGRDDQRVERLPVDWNGDGRSTIDVDFDGDGRVAGERVLLGSFEDHSIHAGEGQGEFVDFPVAIEGIPMAGPHAVELTQDGTLAYTAFPTRNAIVVFNLDHGSVARVFGLSRTQHAADLTFDDSVEFEETLDAWREPVDLALALGDRLLVTADGGLTFGQDRDATGGGGRTVSVFDARTGHLVGDTGSDLDRLAARVEAYRDETSPFRGSRPFCLVATSLQDRPLAVVGLRDAGALGLVTLHPEHPPRVAAMTALESSAPETTPTGQVKRLAPVDVAVLRVGARCLVAVATAEGHVALVEVLRVD